ncbi:MAG: FtsW/RodA/SpoVE family cell cycle protein, partial [Chitinispirillaceae bacterium]|nr:FtsW/RodA/SpoVE family cell cycle protein [Chitinispirillaceae bacterium]
IGIAILFMAGVNFFYLAGVIVVCLPFMVFAALRMPHSRARIFNFINGKDNISELGYQAYQSIVGLGHGGIFGTGIGKGDQKYFFLPEPHTDFAISILGEELGFIGIVMIAAIFSFIIYRGTRIALKAPDRFGQLMAFGFTFTIAIYAMFHSAVAVGLLPTTGIPLPFISYGGMNLIFMCISIGIILNISSQAKESGISSSTSRYYVKELKR